MTDHSQSGNTAVIVLIVAVVVIAAGSVFYFSGASPQESDSDAAADQMDPATDPMMDGDSADTDPGMAGDSRDQIAPEDEFAMDDMGDEDMMNDEMMADDEMAAEGAENPLAPAGIYTDYSESELALATEDGGKAVIFFAADWCPTCQAAEAAFIENRPDIPSDVTILKADYDTEDTLKTKYGVTSQHTFVQVDENGEMITIWSGGDIPELVANIQ